MCNNNSNSKDSVKRKIDGTKPRFYADATCITRRSFIKYIKGEPREEYNPSWLKPYTSPYPKPNIFYPFMEETNPFERVKISHERELIFKNQRFDSPTEPYESRDPYSDIGATAKYLETKPTCFAIFGKPDLNSAKLAEKIANTWNCVLISALPLLQREIQSETEEGMRLKGILESGGYVGFESMMGLIRDRLKKRDVKHKGYVVEGLPLIPNEKLDFSSYATMNDDDSCICDDTSPCAKPIKYEEEIPKQVNEIFKEWSMPPTVIIYIASPDEDVIEKRQYFRMDVMNGEIVDTTLTDTNLDIEILLSQTDIGYSRTISFNPYEEFMNEERILDQDRKKYLVKRISDIQTCNIEKQCRLYKEFALPVIDKWLLLYCPENIIRVDGRTPISRMLQVINARLRLLPIPRVISPRKMLDESEVEYGGEAPVALIEDEFKNMSNEQVYRELAHRATVNPRFPWGLSLFAYLCPVELALGRTVDGLPKHSVRFMNKIYFLSSPEAVDLFMQNPRLFLLPPYPRPVCKIVVFGPSYSGKSELCRELARVLGATVINVKEKEQAIIEERLNAKILIATREKLPGAINDLKQSLELERDKKESNRQSSLDSWYEKVVPIVQRFCELLENMESPKGSDSGEEEVVVQEELESLRETLRLYDLEEIESNVLMQNEFKSNSEALWDYAPEYLTMEEPPIREITEFDPEVLDIVEERIKYLYDEPIDLTVSEKVEIVIEGVQNVPREEIDDELSRDPSYIVDGMYSNREIWQKVIDANIVFEHAILLYDREPFNYLIGRKKRFEKNYFDADNAETPEEYLLDDFRKKTMTLSEYISHLRQFASEWKTLKNNVQDVTKNYIVCDLATVSNVSQYVVNEIQNRYMPKATIVSDEEKMRNRESYEYDNLLLGGEDNFEDELKPGDNSHENYPYGECGYYCPVALMKHNVFWKGTDDFSVSYLDKLYLFSSDEAMKEFVKNPRDYSIPFTKPARNIPPLRVCVVGTRGSGKSKLCDSISREYGLAHVNYYDGFTEFMKSRAIPPFTHIDMLIDNEPTEGIDLPEDLKDRNYVYDPKTVQHFIRQYWKKGGTLPDRMAKDCLLDFFRPPFDNRSIIFDGFPSCVEDANLALDKFAVPEVVIELQCSLESCIERALPEVMSYWEKREEAKRELEEQKYYKALEDYTSRREIWIRKMLRERRSEKRMQETEMYAAEQIDLADDDIEPQDIPSTVLKGIYSDYSVDWHTHDDSIVELEEMWQSENPQPEMFTDWEDPEDVKERVVNALQVIYSNDANKLENTRKGFEDESITWIEIDAEKDSSDVLMRVMEILDPYIFRDAVMLERTYVVDCDTAERLLDQGYYLLSSFGRWCPVQLYKKKNPVHMFLALEAEHDIWPVIYRTQIYFLGGKEAETAFRKNPLKYLEQDSCSPVVPLRIAIIGPPKCGKSSLARRFGRKYGLRIITRGSALREVLKRYSWTNLAKVILSHLHEGNTVPDEYVIRAIEMSSMDPRAVSQGVVFDGFPEVRKELELMTFRGLQPMIILDLKVDLEFCLECLESAADERRSPPTFSKEFFSIRYEAWRAEEQNYRDWLQKYSRNVIELDATNSRAYTWARAEEAVLARFALLKTYFRECDYEKVQNLEFMCVSPYEFRKRQSEEFEAYCPVCLVHDNAFVISGPPPQAQGMVQFKGNYYWICSRHLADFYMDPMAYLPPRNSVKLPEDRPRILDGNVDLECICWGSRLQAQGYCVVTYIDNLPRRRIVPGHTTLGVSYRGKLFLFCTSECREKFLMHCTRYADAKPKLITSIPPIDLRKLPDLGFLEQTVLDIIVQAVSEVSELRPKIPGLSPAASAAVYIGVFLKTHNTGCELREIEIYEGVNERMMCHAQILKVSTKNMRKIVNPFVNLPPYVINNLGEDVSHYSQVSSKLINMIKFRRTSPTQLLVDPDDDPDY